VHRNAGRYKNENVPVGGVQAEQGQRSSQVDAGGRFGNDRRNHIRPKNLIEVI
jgi:hypothetical protein